MAPEVRASFVGQLPGSHVQRASELRLMATATLLTSVIMLSLSSCLASEV